MQEPQSPGLPSPPEKEPGAEVTGAAPTRRYTFPKEEHLCRKKLIEELFSKQGSSFGVYPLRSVWVASPAPTAAPPQVLIVAHSYTSTHVPPLDVYPDGHEHV